MSFWVIYSEEMKALARGRFTLFSAAAILVLLLAFAAGVAPGADSLWFFLFFVYALIPSIFGPFSAMQMAGPRTTRFVQALFTSPVSKWDYVVAKFLVCLTVGFLYLLSTLPFVLVYASHIELPLRYKEFLWIGLGMVFFTVGWGVLLGTIFTGRSLAAPVSLSSLVLLFAFAVPFQMVTATATYSPTVRDAIIRLLHLSPQVNLLDIEEAYEGLRVTEPHQSLYALGAAAVLLYALSIWIFLGHQGVETWETRKAWRRLLVLLVVGTALLPALVSPMEYKTKNSGQVDRFSIDQSGPIMMGFLVEPGTTPDLDQSQHEPPTEASTRLRVGVTEPQDLLLILGMPAGSNLTDIHVRTRAQSGLHLTGAGNLTLPKPPTNEGVRVTHFEGRAMVLRIPVNVTAQQATALAANIYRIRVELTWQSHDHSEDASIDFPVRADIPGTSLQMALAGAPLPLLCLVAPIVRRIRRR